jgi:ribonuclease D
MFDLRFMSAAWDASPANVACTKIAAKLMLLPHREQSLAPLARRYLGVHLDKGEQVSDWTASELTDSQLKYAAADVRHLQGLLESLRKDLAKEDRWELAQACFAHLPVRVALELQGLDDVFVY